MFLRIVFMSLKRLQWITDLKSTASEDGKSNLAETLCKPKKQLRRNPRKQGNQR